MECPPKIKDTDRNAPQNQRYKKTKPSFCSSQTRQQDMLRLKFSTTPSIPQNKLNTTFFSLISVTKSFSLSQDS